MLQIKRFAAKMPPVPRGTLAAKFAKNKFLLKRLGGQLSHPHPKKSFKLLIQKVWRGDLADEPGILRVIRSFSQKTLNIHVILNGAH
jgi:hypothetical protein